MAARQQSDGFENLATQGIWDRDRGAFDDWEMA